MKSEDVGGYTDYKGFRIQQVRERFDTDQEGDVGRIAFDVRKPMNNGTYYVLATQRMMMAEAMEYIDSLDK